MMREWAEAELRRAGLFDADSDYDGELGPVVLKMIDLFAEEGHSGASAMMALSLFSKLVRFQPLTPLTGDDDEWMLVGEGMWQNRRCSGVFKWADGTACYIDGKVFREPNGATFTSRDSHVPITFPYTPITEIVDVPASDA